MTDRPSQRRLWILLFLLAASLWSVHINRPVDLPNWHEFDYTAIARNFLREGSNILYPRIDWRGDGPGFTEMEFPIIPWTMAQFYRVFGIHEIVGRLLSIACMLLSLFYLMRLARKFLPESAALLAGLFFVVSHVVTQMATAIQPEAMMLLFYLMAVYYFLDWYDHPRWRSYALAASSFAGAMLVKSPAAHLTIFFLLWSLYKEGSRAFRRPALYLFAVVAFIPVILWYGHASHLWQQFHNSMGVSNEDHWIGVDILKRPKVILNLLSIDVLLIGGAGGILVALFTVWNDRLRSPLNNMALRWLLAITIYLLVIIRTSGAYWAAYYHVIVVPPLALLFAAGISRVGLDWRRVLGWCGLAALFLVPLFVFGARLNLTRLPGVFQDLFAARFSALALLGAALITLLCVARRANASLPAAAGLMTVGCLAYFLISGQLLLGTWKNFGVVTPVYASAACVASKIASDTLIVASGGPCLDAAGHRVANNAPNQFYWLDRKGFSTCQGNESLTQLKSFAKRGAGYFVADKISIDMQPGFEAELEKSYVKLADCGPILLFKLGKY